MKSAAAFSIFMIFCQCVTAHAQMPDPATFPFTVNASTSLNAPAEGSLDGSSWKEVTDLDAMRKSVKGRYLIVTEVAEVAGETEIEEWSLHDTLVVEGSARKAPDSERAIFLGCAENDCQTQRIIERTGGTNGLYQYHWKGPSLSLKTLEPRRVNWKGLQIQGEKLYLNRSDGIFFLSSGAMNAELVNQYLKLMNATDFFGRPSAKQADRELQWVSIGLSQIKEVSSQKFAKILQGFGLK